MILTKITIARIYTLEGHDQLNHALDILRDEEKMIGVTVFRGIEGIGASGQLHSSSLIDLSLDLPVIIEFYDEPEKVTRAIQALQSRLDFKHIVSWPATAHIQSNS